MRGEAIDEEPVEVGYSSHEGAERADWGDDKLELVDGTHPVVYPGAGSHANKYTEALYIGSSAEAGVGCDDTRGPHLELRPDVKTIPSDAAPPQRRFPGSCSRVAGASSSRPSSTDRRDPTSRRQWTEPIAWSEGGGTGATQYRPEACSARVRPTSSAVRSREARQRSSSSAQPDGQRSSSSVR